jgi:predicted phosphodiesterase
MKIQILADLHLEFLNDRPTDSSRTLLQRICATPAEVTVIAGDLYTKGRSVRKITELFPPGRPVVFVAGNHDHYGGAYLHNLERMRRDAAAMPSVHFLEQETVEIGGTVFLGCCLWSDGRLWEPAGSYSYPETVRALETGMNDYRRIRFTSGGAAYRRLRPADSIRIHQESVGWLREQFAKHKGRKIVVVTHHAPSIRSVQEKLQQDILTATYASHLADLVEQSGAALWVHGHTHNQVDYQVGQTRVVANCLGYAFDFAETAGFRSDLVVDV